jgi:preprotein translocase subunit SecA
MTVAHRQRPMTDAGPLSVGTPYVEQADRRENRLDSALLRAWGRISPHVLSRLWRRQLDRVVQRAEDQEKRLIALPDERLRQTADALRGRLSSANCNLDDIGLAFALAREAAHRHTGMRHFRVQLLGGAAMTVGVLAEMQTGEGKSLTALLPAVAAALSGRPVHIVTVNDYLARRDAELFRPAFNALGLTVGLIEHAQQPQDRQRAYACDVTYCTNKELVFDYLRDRLALGARRGRARLLVDELFKTRLAGQSQRLLLRGLHFAIVDEADSVLIDEARTPLILSGMPGEAENDAGLYETALDFARRLVPGEDFQVLANRKAIRLTAHGEGRMAELAVGLQGSWAIRRAREELVQQALSAIHFFRRDVQYIVADGKVQIVDEYTGRVMPDRSWERGLHQLIEAKENCAITERRHTLARITYQRFFRRYLHLCGMTGTAIETAGELRAVYGLRVVRIPTNRPLRRTNLGTRILRTAELKWNAVVDSANVAMRQGRPVLIGTRSVDASERVGELLLKAGLQPVILNARQDRREAEIVAGAGQPGRVTVATNMAGRGTDIQLHPAVREAGGLHVILTEYHESRRIDRQLFGRAGRQGDPGSFESIVALDDELFHRFAGKHLLRIVTSGVRGAKQVPAVIAHALRCHSQSGAERLHGRARRMTLAEDHRWNKSLSFAGTE